MFTKKFGRVLRTLGIFIIMLVLFCSCGFPANSVLCSSGDILSQLNISHAENGTSNSAFDDSDMSQTEELVQSYKGQFYEKYTNSLDSLYLVTTEDWFFKILFENPIDAWYDAKRVETISPNELIEFEKVAQANWSREIKESLQILFELLPERTQTLMEEQVAWENALNIRLDNIQQIACDLFIDGSEQHAILAAEQTKLTRERAFYLMYMEYIALTVQSPQNSNDLEQLLAIKFVEG